MTDQSTGWTMNKSLLFLLATLAFGISGYQRWLKQDWLALGTVIVAWLLVLWVIQRHRRRGDAVLAVQLQPLLSSLSVDGDWLCIAGERLPRQTVSRVEMGVIDQQRAYLYLTIENEAPVPAEKRRFLLPYAEYQPVLQQLTAALPQARWLLPQD